ncbi:hypothetical protein [Bacillus sinesaloumensis]|uniref:hypothetical protein n=1 Tax=Litchfieldia sinesaloumensis TaxID=1926280 RepID=UPI00098893C2|nr:hypothetical protein [Bacillus sinesaloumensis]
MSSIGVLVLPILILFIAIIVLLFVYMRKRLSGPKNTKAFLGIYFGILTVSVIVYYFIPTSSFVSEKPETKNITYQEVHEAIDSGRIKEVEAIREKERWTLPYSGNELNIETIENVNMLTIYEKKDTNDSTIEVIYYVANTNYNGYDFYSEIPSPFISIENNQLLAYPPTQYEIQLYSFHNNIVISQFRGGGITEEFDSSLNDDKPVNYDFLYIKVPKNLTLTGSEFINFIGE